MSDFEANLAATGDVFAAYDRLIARGLVKPGPTDRGITDEGMRTLADLLAVLTFQTGSGSSHAEQVASASARAMLSALGDLFGEIANQPTLDAQTLQLLAAAVRTARA